MSAIVDVEQITANADDNNEVQEATNSPSWVTDVINFYLRYGGELVSDQQYRDRTDVCQQCPHAGKVVLPNGLQLQEVPGCTKCGCPFATKPRAKKYFSLKKLRMVKAECPLGKWENVDQNFD